MPYYDNYAMVKDGVASRTALPQDLWTLPPEALLDLEWLATSYPIVSAAQWWPIEDQSTPLGRYQSYGDETLTLDVDRTVVLSVRPVRDWTAQEILDHKASIERHITVLAFRNRFTAAEKVAFEMAQIDDPAAALEVRQAAAGVRVMEKDLNAGAYVDLNLVANQAAIHALEPLGVIAAGRAEQIIWGDIEPYEVP